MKRVVVYLSGPITKGDRNANIAQFNRAHELLMRSGKYAIINPGLTGFLPWAWNMPHDEWIANDLPLVERCDLLIRLPGESDGADAEVRHAQKHGIPIVWLATPSLENIGNILPEEALACV